MLKMNEINAGGYMIEKRIQLPLLMMVLSVAVVLGVLSGCKTADVVVPPAGHTVSMSGVMHQPDLLDPLNHCTTCHGSDLRGGTGGQPSCFSCHNQKW